MKIGILSRKASLYSTNRLKEAALQRGHTVQIVDYLRCYMNIAAHHPTVGYQGKVLTDIDAIIPRIGASRTFYGTAVVRQFEMGGTYSVASSQGISRSRDKLRCMQLLARQGVGLPVTSCANSTKDIDSLLEIVGGAPVIIKLLEGTQGMGVVLAETKKAAESVIGAFRQLNANILVQEFVREAKGSDFRAFVVGGKVVASMQRTAAVGEFRSNVHRGGQATKVKLHPEERRMVIRAAQIMGLDVAGVDFMRSNHGPVVLEVNSSPGLEGIEKSTGKDVAGAIIDYLAIEAAAHDARHRKPMRD